MKNSSRTSYEIKAVHPSTWNHKKLKSILNKCKKKKVLVVGDVGVDRYTVGLVERISPEAPVPIVLVQEERLKLGLAANVADNIRTLGGVPFLLGVVGEDRAAEDFRKILETSDISSSHLVTDSTRRTVLKERVVSDRQQIVRVDYESPHKMGETVEKEILNRIQKILPKVDAVIVEDYAKGVVTHDLAAAIFKMAKKEKKLAAVDPNLRTPTGMYRGASILTPNTKEAEHLSGVAIHDLHSLCKAGFAILRKTEAQYVVITRGKDGIAIFQQEKGKNKNREVHLIPTYAREVYDVSGAGDTVISVLMLCLVAGATIEEAAVLSNLAAGVEVGKRGTATVSPEEILQFLASFES